MGINQPSLTLWDDSWVHEGGQCEVGDDEEGDDTLVRWHPWKAVQVELAAGRECGVMGSAVDTGGGVLLTDSRRRGRWS